jgi:hypothetical protein
VRIVGVAVGATVALLGACLVARLTVRTLGRSFEHTGPAAAVCSLASTGVAMAAIAGGMLAADPETTANDFRVLAILSVLGGGSMGVPYPYSRDFTTTTSAPLDARIEFVTSTNTKAPFRPVPGMLSRSSLDAPFEWTSNTVKLGFTLTPRGMRRSYQDLCRAAGVEDDVQKFICGHSTGPIARRETGSRMTRHYSTFRPDETRAAIEKVAALVLAPPAKSRSA